MTVDDHDNDRLRCENEIARLKKELKRVTNTYMQNQEYIAERYNDVNNRLQTTRRSANIERARAERELARSKWLERVVVECSQASASERIRADTLQNDLSLERTKTNALRGQLKAILKNFRQ